MKLAHFHDKSISDFIAVKEKLVQVCKDLEKENASSCK